MIAPRTLSIQQKANGAEICWESFQKIQKLLYFRTSGPFNRNFRKLLEESQMESIFPVRNVRNFDISCKFVHFPEVSWKCYSIRHWKFPKFKPGIFDRMERTPKNRHTKVFSETWLWRSTTWQCAVEKELLQHSSLSVLPAWLLHTDCYGHLPCATFCFNLNTYDNTRWIEALFNCYTTRNSYCSIFPESV